MTLEQKPFEEMLSVQNNKLYQRFLPSSQEFGVGTVLWPVIYCHVFLAFLAKVFEPLSLTCFEIGCCKATAEDVKLKQATLGCWWEYRVTSPKLFYLLRRQFSDCCCLSLSFVTFPPSYRTSQIERDHKRPSGPTFCGKGNLDEII